MKKLSFKCQANFCNNYTTTRYCAEHRKTYTLLNNADAFKRCKESSSQAKAFYSSSRWRKTTALFRAYNPLCEECKKQGLIVPVKLVHHVPGIDFLLDNGSNPCDFKYLQGLCHNCHQKELRKKKG